MFTHAANKPQPFVRISGGGKGREGQACSKGRREETLIIYALPLGTPWHIVRKGGVQYCHLRLRTFDILDCEYDGMPRGGAFGSP